MENVQFHHYKDFLGELTVTYKRTQKLTPNITNSKDLDTFIRPYFEECMDSHEEMRIIHLNNANYILNVHHHSKGGTAGTVADAKLILQQALLLKATGIVIIHNHPSGTLKPSLADMNLTAKLKTGCEILDLRLLDSMIITRETYYSFMDEGVL